MIIHTKNNNLNNLNGVVKRGFNQKPSDIIDSINLEKKKMEDYKNKQNSSTKTNMDLNDKINSLNTINRKSI